VYDVDPKVILLRAPSEIEIKIYLNRSTTNFKIIDEIIEAKYANQLK
jgi:hypothetical protein